MDKRVIGSVISTGILSFSGIVIETSMNVAFPTLMSQFHISVSLVQWLTTGYLLVLSLIIPISSFLKKKFKTKILFIVSNLLFIVGVFLSMLAPDFLTILFGRLMQGIGTGIALPLMFNVIVERVNVNKIGTVMGFANLIIAFAPAVGPTLGGFIVQRFGWRYIFFILLPILFISLYIGIKSIDQISSIEMLKFNWVNWIFLIISFSCLIFAISLINHWKLYKIKIIILFVVSLLFIIIFYLDANRPHSLINKNLFHNYKFDLSAIVLMISQFSILGLSFLIPNFAQLVLHKNAFISGFLLFPGATLGIFLSILGGRCLDKYGAKIPIIFGFVVYAVSMLMFTLFLPKIENYQIVLFFVLAIIGQSFSSGNILTNALIQLPESLNADGNAVLNTLQQLSGALGTLIIADIVSTLRFYNLNDLSIGTMIGSRYSFVLLFVMQLIAIVLNIFIFKNKSKS